MRCLKRLFIGLLIFSWLFLSWPQVGWGPKLVQAETVDLMVTGCDVNNVVDANCYSAILADGGSNMTLIKNGHIDALFETMTASSINSATLYYDSWGILSGSWGIYVKDARDGTTICSVDPAPEDTGETSNSISCNLTTTQLANGIWLQVNNNDDKGPQTINLDYIRLYVDYVAPVVSISMDTDGAVAFGYLATNTTEDTTILGINDVEIVRVDSGPANIDVQSTNFSDGSNTWSLNTSSGSDQVHWEFSKDGLSFNSFDLVDTLYSLDTNVTTSGTTNLYLKITAPTDTSSYNQHSATVTVVASVP